MVIVEFLQQQATQRCIGNKTQIGQERTQV
jgi:hypothetical protein